jgi:hypothetical protein
MQPFHRRSLFPPKANVPMVTATRDKLALEMRMAGETLIGRPSIDAYNTLSKIFAALERAGMRTDLVRPGSRIMCAICDRYEETRTITVGREEATGLRQAVADIDAGLHRVPLQRLERAVAEVEVFCAVTDHTPDNEN